MDSASTRSRKFQMTSFPVFGIGNGMPPEQPSTDKPLLVVLHWVALVKVFW
ncbi:hypothetical protein D3C87_1870620 [compost metagenome]